LISPATTGGRRSEKVHKELCRLFDARPDSVVGPRSVPIGPGQTMVLPVRGGMATVRFLATHLRSRSTPSRCSPGSARRLRRASMTSTGSEWS